jgi:hypothetical protein
VFGEYLNAPHGNGHCNSHGSIKKNKTKLKVGEFAISWAPIT